MPYFGELSTDNIADVVISDAKVFISDGVLTDTLVFTLDLNTFPPVYYKGTNPLLKGVPGKSYWLTVWALGDTLTAVTTIPQIIALDSLFWKPENGPQDSIGFGWGHLTDPDTLGNIYRLFAKRQGYAGYRPAGNTSTLSDRLFNGQSTDFNFVRPRQQPSWFPDTSSVDEPDEERFRFKRGDSIYVKFCTLDPAAYDFIRTYEIAAGSFGNPFASPTFVKTNIQGGGLGGWVGYGVSYHSCYVPE
jgi:hypothetical protein